MSKCVSQNLPKTFLSKFKWLCQSQNTVYLVKTQTWPQNKYNCCTYFCGRDKRKHWSLSWSWSEETCLFPSKSTSMLHLHASQSPLSLTKLDSLKAELDSIPHPTLKTDIGVADVSTDELSDAQSLFRRDFTWAWSQRESLGCCGDTTRV